MQIINHVPCQALGKRKKKLSSPPICLILPLSQRGKIWKLKMFLPVCSSLSLTWSWVTKALRLMAVKPWVHIPAFLCHVRLPAFSSTSSQHLGGAAVTVCCSPPGSGAKSPWCCSPELGHGPGAGSCCRVLLRGPVPSRLPDWFMVSQAGISVPKHWRVEPSVSVNSLQGNNAT